MDNNLDDDCTSYAETWINNCINDDYITATGNDVETLYAFDSNPISSLWGGIVTWNSVNNIGIDDSNIDFDESCIIDGDDSDCSGRLTFSYIPQCLPSFSVRYFMAELTELCEASEQDVCGVCGGDGPVTWYNDADRDGLGDPNNFKINCLPGYCIEDESLSYTECNDVNNSWDWLSMGICSDGNGNELSNPTALGDFEFCNSIIENYPQYNATWLWDRGFSTNNYDNDDTNSECPEGQEPDCLGICGGILVDDDCGVCGGDNSSCTGCMDDTACNYSLTVTISGECEYSEVNYDCSGNCNVDVDCAGICGGSATEDVCGICGGSILEIENCVECPESDPEDCAGICGGSLLEDDCNVCDGDNSSCTGCMDDTACNYSLNATISGECEYSEVNYDCSGNCNVEVDCAGDCGGDAMEDCAGVCNGDATTDGTSCLSIDNHIPESFSINNIYPNPFNPVVNIEYSLANSELVNISIYDLNGQIVSQLFSGHQSVGNHHTSWHASEMSSGIYIITIQSGNIILSDQIILLK